MMVNTSFEAYAPRPEALQKTSKGTAGQAAQAPPKAQGSADTGAPLIPTAALFDAVDVVLDLSKEGRDLYGSYSALSQEDRSLFIDIIGNVMGQGVVGNESLEVRGSSQKSYASTRLGSEELRHAKPSSPPANNSPIIQMDITV